jgi:hypothetical protein
MRFIKPSGAVAPITKAAGLPIRDTVDGPAATILFLTSSAKNQTPGTGHIVNQVNGLAPEQVPRRNRN